MTARERTLGKTRAKNSPQLRPREPWCAEVIHYISHCPLCGSLVAARLPKKGMPYLSCARCMSRLFANSDRAASFWIISDFGLNLAAQYSGKVLVKYRELVRYPAVIAAKGPPQLDPRKNRPDTYEQRYAWREEVAKFDLLRELFEAGGQCALCGQIAEWHRGKKGRYQLCRLCMTMLFVNSPLGLAGLMVRARYLSRLCEAGRRKLESPPRSWALRYRRSRGR